MKKFTKLFLSCAAVAVVTAAVASTAMAAGEVKATYDNDAKKLYVAADYTAEQKTLLIVPKGTDLTSISSENANTLIKQIDQQASSYYAAAQNDGKGVEVATKELADGQYTVYMGGAGQVYSGDFTVGEVTSTRLLGDANGNDEIAVNDVSTIVNHLLGKKPLTGEDLVSADANDNGEVAVNDASQIVNYILGKASNVDGVKTIADKKYQTVE